VTARRRMPLPRRPRSLGHGIARAVCGLVVAWALLVIPAPVCAQSATAAAVTTPRRQLVIPFDNAGREGRLYWLSEASAVVLTDDLLALRIPAITRDDRLRAFERLHVPPVAALSHATVIRIGQVVGASQVVRGVFDVQGDRLTVRARTIRLDTGRLSPEIVEQGPLTDFFAVYARVARRIAPDSHVTPEEMEQGHPPLAAFEQFIKGVLAEGPDARISFLSQALRLAPTFQRARIALWSAYTDQSDTLKALATASQVPADSRLSRQARFLVSMSQMTLGQFAEAYDTLVALNRDAADPALLNNIGVVQMRRPAGASGGRAVSFFTNATKLDDGDSDLFFNLGYAYWIDRDIPAAITWLRETVRRNPADDQAHYVLGVALQMSGSTAEAAREKELAKRLSSVYADWESKPQQGVNGVPRGLERLKTDIDVSSALRMDSVIVASEQRDQRDVATFHLDAGRRLYQAERDDEAIAELRRAVYLAPYQSEAHLLLGRIYLREGRLDDAVDALKISIWSEDTIAAHLALAQAYVAAKDTSAARAELQIVTRREPANAEAHRMLDRLP
jgi:predicted Zn-dependent protease/TolB-like protein